MKTNVHYSTDYREPEYDIPEPTPNFTIAPNNSDKLWAWAQSNFLSHWGDPLQLLVQRPIPQLVLQPKLNSLAKWLSWFEFKIFSTHLVQPCCAVVLSCFYWQVIVRCISSLLQFRAQWRCCRCRTNPLLSHSAPSLFLLYFIQQKYVFLLPKTWLLVCFCVHGHSVAWSWNWPHRRPRAQSISRNMYTQILRVHGQMEMEQVLWKSVRITPLLPEVSCCYIRYNLHWNDKHVPDSATESTLS